MYARSQNRKRWTGTAFLTGLTLCLSLFACTTQQRVPQPARAGSARRTTPLSATTKTQERQRQVEALVRNVISGFSRLGFQLDASKIHVELAPPGRFIAGIARNARFYELPGIYDALVAVAHLLGAPLSRSVDELRTLAPLAVNEVTEAYYDIARETLVIRDDATTNAPALTDVIAHELGHAYRNGLPGGIKGYIALHNGSVDELRAVNSLLEGEATLFAEAYRLSERGLGIEVLDPTLMDPTVGRLTTGKDYSLVYDAGRQFLLTRHKNGGMKAVVEAVTFPPTSTEQLLHPEKFGIDLPSTVSLPQVPDLLQDSTVVFEGTFGELLLYFSLLQVTRDFFHARLAVTGWDGDRLRVLQQRDGSYCLSWKILWDREKDAAQFCQWVEPLLKDQTHSRIRCHGTTTNLAYAATTEQADALERSFTSVAGMTPVDPIGSESTQAAENDYLRVEALRPRLRGTRWDWPALGLSFELPVGFFPFSLRGVDILAMLPVDGFANNITVTYEQDLYPGQFDLYLESQKRILSATGHVGLRNYPVTAAGHPCMVIETRVPNEQGEANAILLVIPRASGTLLTVTVATGKGQQALARQLVESLARSLELQESPSR